MLCEALFINESDIVKFSKSAPYRYKKYSIPKRNGKGTRLIAHPSKELKTIQRLLIDFLAPFLPVSDYAFAYKKNFNIKDNAQVHCKTKYMLKMDFKDFFPSITPDLLFSELSKCNIEISETDKEVLSGLLFWKITRKSSLRLSIGAPSSPLISNFVMFDFDIKLSDFCNKNNINYTRYADDITFSTNEKEVLFEMPNMVYKILGNTTQNRIKINAEKTIFSSKKHNRHVTGLTLTNSGTVSIGRKKKRMISSLVHKATLAPMDYENLMKLSGLLSYSFHIEPDFKNRLETKYGINTIQAILSQQLTKN